MLRIARALVVAAATAVAFSACSRITVESSAEPDWSPASAATYAWRPDPAGGTGDPRGDEAHLVQAIRAAADRELAAKGYRRADPDDADFQIGYWLAVEVREVASPRGSANWEDSDRPPGYWESPISVPPSRIEKGTVGIYAVAGDPPRNVWRGVARGVFKHNASRADRAARVGDAVRRILADFASRATG